MTSERFRLLIEAGPGDVPGIVRLRALLKTMLRSYGLKCVAAKQTTATTDARGSTETASNAKDDDSIVHKRKRVKREAT
ncbi:MAG: hypothetical protein WCJ09_23180 [Planctomycetota bacterium]